MILKTSNAHLADPNILVHHPVAHEAVKRPLEAGGLVLLEAKVAHPCKAIATQEAVQQVLWFAGAINMARQISVSVEPAKCSLRQVRLLCSLR